MARHLPPLAAADLPPALTERGLFVRERADGLYRTTTYLLAKIIEELLLAFLGSLVVSIMVFYAVALTGSFLTFWLSYYITLCNGIAVAYLVGGPQPGRSDGLLLSWHGCRHTCVGCLHAVQ